jgi:hypothetical protein
MGGAHRFVVIFAAVAFPAVVSIPVQEPEKPPISTQVCKYLDTLAGSWDVAIHYKLGPGQERNGTARCEAKWILDNHFLQQEYQSRMNGKPFTVIQWLGYDDAKQKVVEIHLNSMNGVHFNEGSVSADGKVFTQLGTVTDGQTKKPSTLRTVYTIMDNDHFTLDWYTTGPDGKEDRSVSMTHKRRKG